MLNYLLGWMVGFGSLGLYLSGFLLPEVRRKNDAIWSGVGLIYALAILTNGDRTTAGLFVGQLASAVLVGWFGWQTLQQRRQLSAPETHTPIPNSVQAVFLFLKQGWERLVATYTSPENDDTDLLASNVKKVSALVRGQRSATPESPVNLPGRFQTDETAQGDFEEDTWADKSPSESATQDPTIDPVPETIVPTVEPGEAEQSLLETIAGVEIRSSDEPSAVSLDATETVEQPSATTPSMEVKTEEVEASAAPPNQPHVQETVAPSMPEIDPQPDPDSQPDPQADPSDPSLNTPTHSEERAEEDWPPKDSSV
jgi:Ycf66 protein N-terminus